MNKQKSMQRYFEKYGILTITIVLFAAFSILFGSKFLSIRNFNASFINQVSVIFVALAAMFPLISGEVNMSLGSMFTLVLLTVSYFTATSKPWYVCLAVALACGFILGFVEGFVVVKMKIPSTLATMGLALVLDSLVNRMTNLLVFYKGVDSYLKHFAKSSVLGFNVTIWFLLAVLAICYYLLDHTPYGRKMYATGISQRVAHLTGIHTDFYRISSYCICGVIIAIGAFLNLILFANPSGSVGPNYFLPGLSIAFLSITTYKSGRFNVIGLTISAIMITFLFSGFSLMLFPTWVESMINGLTLIIVVIFTSKKARTVQAG